MLGRARATAAEHREAARRGRRGLSGGPPDGGRAPAALPGVRQSSRKNASANGSGELGRAAGGATWTWPSARGSWPRRAAEVRGCQAAAPHRGHRGMCACPEKIVRPFFFFFPNALIVLLSLIFCQSNLLHQAALRTQIQVVFSAGRVLGASGLQLRPSK